MVTHQAVSLGQTTDIEENCKLTQSLLQQFEPQHLFPAENREELACLQMKNVTVYLVKQNLTYQTICTNAKISLT